MSEIKLDGSSGYTDTLIPNRFLDYYMPNANGEFVKIYLYLLRALSSEDKDISICHIADIFNHTEKDVIRALKYWEKLSLIDLCFDSDKSLTGITLKPINAGYTTDDGTHIEIQSAPVTSTHQDNYHDSNNDAADNVSIYVSEGSPSYSGEAMRSQNSDMPSGQDNRSTDLNRQSSGTIYTAQQHSHNDSSAHGTESNPETRHKHTYTANEIKTFRAKDEVCEFLYLAEKYIGKPLSGADVNSLLYIYDILEFEPDLIEYLVEYCVTNGHKSLRYIEKVAISWADEGINSVELAKANTTLFSKSCYPVLKAFGLNGRNPGAGEKAMIVKWTNSYGFDMDIILEACNRTINAIHQPSFEYADSILSKWNDKKIRTLSDIKALDDEHNKTKAAGNHSDSNSYSVKPNAKSASGNKARNSFNDFTQRSYDYDELEKKLLNNSNV